MQKCGEILPGREDTYSRPRGFNIVGASDPAAPAVPTPMQSSEAGALHANH